ncbi:unnamed protein product [Linum tenue]|uniref:Uncharacterized protein n=1 Tax=Linum tenue TaxID=586396 RepID=A0AAV0P7K8_9ROSI|nr:unnamed protein product [Linum tenue]
MTKSRDLQTPLKELSRASETANRRSKESQSKKPRNVEILPPEIVISVAVVQPRNRIFHSSFFLVSQIAKRSLTGEFTTISEDASIETAGDGSGTSEVLDAEHNDELVKNSLILSPTLSGTSKITPPSSDAPPTSKATKVSPNGVDKLVHLANRPAEAAIIIGLLRKVQLEAPKSGDANNRYMKILKELAKVIADECYDLPEERVWLMKFLSGKRGVLFLCLLNWISVFCMLVYFNGGRGGGSDSGISPT